MIDRYVNVISITRGVTPAITMVLPEEYDLSMSSNVYVTFATRSGKILVDKSGDEVRVNGNECTVDLTQKETLSLPIGDVVGVVNWTYLQDDAVKRDCSTEFQIIVERNLKEEVLG